jgi:hypothetical protein
MENKDTTTEQKARVKPVILYSSVQEWDTAVEEAMTAIQKGVTKHVVEDQFEYCYMRGYGGLTPRQYNVYLPACISSALEKLTGDTEWSRDVADDIIQGVRSTFTGFDVAGLWEHIYDTTSAQQLSDVVYNSVADRLNGNHSDSILGDCVKFKCPACGEVCMWLEDSGACETCSGSSQPKLLL